MPQEVFSHKLVAVFIRSQMSHRDRCHGFISILIISSSGGRDAWNRVHLTGITLRYLFSMMMAACVKEQKINAAIIVHGLVHFRLPSRSVI